MTLGQTLKTYIEKSGRKQADIAMTWLEAWRKQGTGKDWKDSTLFSHLNRCLQDNAQGISFFFSDRARAVLLLDTLDVPEADRPAILELAGQALVPVVTPPQIIIDATTWASEVTHALALFDAIERQIVAEGPFPILLLIRDDHFKHLPRTYDEFKEQDKVRFERMKSPEEAWRSIQESAEEQGLVISSRRFPVFDRWLATDFNGRELVFAPPGGLSSFRSSGRLPALPDVAHDLSALVSSPQLPQVVLPEHPHELHRLMVDLRTEEGTTRLKLSPEARQSFAVALGIPVTSTARERLEADIAGLTQKLPVPLTTASPEALDQARVRAMRRGLGPTAFRVGDAVHLINLDATVTGTLGEPPWLHLEHIPTRPNPLSRLLEGVAGWTQDDFLEDPFLDQLIERLDPNRLERAGFWHARAGLLLTQALQVQEPPVVADWQPALQEVLAADPPFCLLRVRGAGDPIAFGRWKFPAFAIPKRLYERASEQRALLQLPPVTDVLVSREDELMGVQGLGSQSFHTGSFFMPADAEAARDAELLLEIFEASSSRDWRVREPLETKYGERLASSSSEIWTGVAVELADTFWDEADRELATVWMALRDAVLTASRIRLPNGSILLQLSPGVLAEIRVTRRRSPPRDSRVQASVLRPFLHTKGERYSQPTFELLDLQRIMPTHGTTGGYEFGPSLPRGIHIHGERFNAEIRFRASSLLTGTSPSLQPVAAVAAVQQLAAVDDDVDDDD